MSSEFTQNIAPHNGGSGAPPEATPDASERAPITEQEVGEYREQDRFLPVSVPPSLGIGIRTFSLFISSVTNE